MLATCPPIPVPRDVKHISLGRNGRTEGTHRDVAELLVEKRVQKRNHLAGPSLQVVLNDGRPVDLGASVGAGDVVEDGHGEEA